jgi:hypothetical protein
MFEGVTDEYKQLGVYAAAGSLNRQKFKKKLPYCRVVNKIRQ